MQSEQINEIVAAMLATQKQCEAVVKDSTNPHFKSSYASLEAVCDTVYPAMHKNGLVVVQVGERLDGKPCLRTTVYHSSGQWLSGLWPLDGGKTDPQGIGSAITYMRRYSLCAMFGLRVSDDDGEAASRAPKQAAPQRKAPAQASAPAPTSAPGSSAVFYGFENKPKGAIYAAWPKGGQKQYAILSTLSMSELRTARDLNQRDMDYWAEKGDDKKVGWSSKAIDMIDNEIASRADDGNSEPF